MSPDDDETHEETTSSDGDGDVRIGDHVRPATDAYHPGVYRVVGASDPVALLRLTDGEGRRERTGHLVTVEPTTVETDFASAENPDGPLDLVAEFQDVVSGMYWTVRELLPRKFR